MKNIRQNLLLLSLIPMTAALSACNKASDLNQDNLSQGMKSYLEKRGNLCLAKNTWPIDVTQKEMDAHGRNAIQMPVLEKAGLVKSSVATVTASEDGQTAQIKVMRYELTPEGKKYYLNQDVRSLRSDGEVQHHQGDFCAARLTLDRVVGWDAVNGVKDPDAVTVRYTYKIDAAPWASNPDILKVFPMIDQLLKGAGKLELQEGFKKTPQGWVAVDL